ncbi:MAG: PA0069 family radical SAM protein [Pseudomonadota bacterium]
MSTHPVRFKPRKGRGAGFNPNNRFEQDQRAAFDDGWGALDEPLAPLRTTLGIDTARSIISSNDSPDIPFDLSVNPYRGCEHGCVYCFARPTHAYYGLSPGLDFESHLLYKPNAAELLRKELSRKRYQCKPIALGINTDAYQPVERELKITRQLLEVMHDFNQPVSIVTKSALIERDLDLLVPMAKKNQVGVMLSITTLNHELARKMEPRATAPQRKLRTLKTLSEAGVPVGILIAPLIPALNDAEMETILQTCHEHGAATAAYVMLRLPHEVKDLFETWLQDHYPLKAEHVLNLMRSIHSGKLYNAEFGARMRGQGEYADLLSKRFKLACKRLGLNQERHSMDCSQFKAVEEDTGQLSLF